MPLADRNNEPESEAAENDTNRSERYRSLHVMQLSTSREIPGFELSDNQGHVMSITALSRDVLSNFGAGLRQVVGGKVGAYVTLLSDGRDVSLTR